MATSWSLVSAKDLSAELRLAQAISDFQSSLGAREKLDFQASQRELSKRPPTAQDVYRLTAEIDIASEKVCSGRVFGPRFMKTLQAVQQFASLGDVIVGGSQNLVACGVWAGVRFALMAMTARASFVSRASEIFMNIGQSAPRYEEIAHLYSESKLLQVYLQEYFVVVVQLCHYIVRCSQQTSIGQFISSLSESKLNSFQSQLYHRGQFIKDEVLAATMSFVRDESSRSDKFRQWMISSSRHRRKLRQRAKLLERCSRYDHEAYWKQLRKAGTARFYTDMLGYRDWKTSNDSRTLNWTGKIGSGKSVLLASIIDDLNLDQTLSHTLVTYFFCEWDNLESLQAKTILGSLARQVLVAYYFQSSQASCWDDFACDSHRLSLDDLATAIKQAMPKEHRLIFVLDGIDDCEVTESAELLSQLAVLQSCIRLHICAATSLPHGNDSLVKQRFQDLQDICILEIPENNPDISTFVKTTLLQRIITGDLIIGDDNLVLEIQNTLIDEAHGMMLWVVLQIEAICAQQTDDDIRKTLEHLPKTLSEAFERELQRCTKRSPTKYRDRIVTLLLGTIRPLTLDEFGEATSVEPGNTVWDPARQINDVNSVLKCCGKLLCVDEESNVVRLVHHSVKQHFITNYLDSSGASIKESVVQSTITNIILTYLNYDVFEKQLTVRAPEMSAQHLTTNVLARAMKSPVAADFTLRLLHQTESSDFDIIKALTKIKNEAASIEQRVFAFKTYAESHYLKHAWTLIVLPNELMIAMFFNIVRRLAPSMWSLVEHHRSVFKGTELRDCNIPVTWSSTEGRATLIATLGDKLSCEILLSITDSNNQNCLEWASEQASQEMLLALAGRCARQDLESAIGVVTAFIVSLDEHRWDLADILFDAFSVEELEIDSALLSLILSKNVDSVAWLLERLSNVRFMNTERDTYRLLLTDHPEKETYIDLDCSFLWIAIDTEQPPMVELLLNHHDLDPEVRADLKWPWMELHRIQQFLVKNEFRLLLEIDLRPVNAPFKPKFLAKSIMAREHDRANIKQRYEICYAKDEILQISAMYQDWWVASNSKRQIGLAHPGDMFLLEEYTSDSVPDSAPESVSVSQLSASKSRPEPAFRSAKELEGGPERDSVEGYQEPGRPPNDKIEKNVHGVVRDIQNAMIKATQTEMVSIGKIRESTAEELEGNVSTAVREAADVDGIESEIEPKHEAGPVNYREEIESEVEFRSEAGSAGYEEDSDSTEQESDGEWPYLARADHDYTANPDDTNEISFAKDEIFSLRKDLGSRWWDAKRSDGHTGIVPSNYMTLLHTASPIH